MPTQAEKRGDPGILEEVGATVHSFLEYFQVRAQLLALEAREGIQHLRMHAALFSVGLLFLLLGYGGGIAAAVSLLARNWHIEWEVMLLWAMVPHLLLGAWLMWLAIQHNAKPLFDSTLDELEKDQSWIRKDLKSGGKRIN